MSRHRVFDIWLTTDDVVTLTPEPAVLSADDLLLDARERGFITGDRVTSPGLPVAKRVAIPFHAIVLVVGADPAQEGPATEEDEP